MGNPECRLVSKYRGLETCTAVSSTHLLAFFFFFFPFIKMLEACFNICWVLSMHSPLLHGFEISSLYCVFSHRRYNCVTLLLGQCFNQPTRGHLEGCTSALLMLWTLQERPFWSYPLDYSPLVVVLTHCMNPTGCCHREEIVVTVRYVLDTVLFN